MTEVVGGTTLGMHSSTILTKGGTYGEGSSTVMIRIEVGGSTIEGTMMGRTIAVTMVGEHIHMVGHIHIMVTVARQIRDGIKGVVVEEEMTMVVGMHIVLKRILIDMILWVMGRGRGLMRLLTLRIGLGRREQGPMAVVEVVMVVLLVGEEEIRIGIAKMMQRREGDSLETLLGRIIVFCIDSTVASLLYVRAMVLRNSKQICIKNMVGYTLVD